MPEPSAPGVLHIVGTPLGNPDDISIRAIRTLQDVDIIACEERRVAIRLLRRHGIEKDLVEINEHTEASAATDILDALRSGKHVALISDCGMPVFADPGTLLVRKAWELSFPVDVVPGPTSVTTALAVCGFDIQSFLFRGFLSANSVERLRQLAQLRSVKVPIVLMDTPYRLGRLLRDAASVLGGDRLCCIACDLTSTQQVIKRGTLSEIVESFQDNVRREFVLIVSGSTPPAKHRSRRRR